MSLDIDLCVGGEVVFTSNITHNLNDMAEEAGFYQFVWRPEEINVRSASELIEPLKRGLRAMVSDPRRFKKFEPENKWGTLEDFVPWLIELLIACEEHPEATIEVSR